MLKAFNCDFRRKNEFMEEGSNLALFTSCHQNHDSSWVVTCPGRYTFLCLACVAEILQNHETPSIKKKYVLNELNNHLGVCGAEIVEVLLTEEELSFHLVGIIFDLLQDGEVILEESQQALLQMCCQLQSDAIVYRLLHRITGQLQADRKFSSSHPLLSLLSKLFHNIPALASVFLDQHGDILDSCLTNMTTSDEKLCTAILAIFIQLIQFCGESIATRGVARKLIDRILIVIGNAQGRDLLEAAVDLMKLLSGDPDNAKTFINVSDRDAAHNMPSIIKKILLSKSDPLKISVVQTIGQLLSNTIDHEFTEQLLEGDIAEFLFECLATTNNVLLSSTFCTLLLMAECESFFSKCHSVLGAESVLRAVDQSVKTKNTEPLQHGLHLLSTILEKQPTDKRLFNGAEVFSHLSETLGSCMKHKDSHIPLQAIKCFRHLLRKDHIPYPINYKCLIEPIQSAMETLQRLPKPLVRGLKRFHSQTQEAHLKPGVQAKLQKQQEVILAGVRLIETAFCLSINLRKDPLVLEESQFTAPSVYDEDHTGRSDLSAFVASLMTCMDDTVIPTVMANYEVLADDNIFHAFVSTLPLPFQLDVSVEYPKKLASSCFLHWALDLNSKLSLENELLHEVIATFIVELCSYLLKISGDQPHDKDDLPRSMQAALDKCKGSSSILSLLMETQEDEECYSFIQPSPLQVTSLLLVHRGCLAVLYSAYLYEDRLYPDEDVMDVLCSSLLHISSQVTGPALKHVLFILANVSEAGSDISKHTVTDAVMRMAESECPSSLYTHESIFLTWIFCTPWVPFDFAQNMLQLWLEHTFDETDELPLEAESTKFILALLKNNERCFLSALELYISGPGHMTSITLSLFEAIFSEQPPMTIQDTFTSCLRSRLPDIYKKITSDKGHKDCDQVVFTLLQLLNFVYKQDINLVVDSTDLKLLHHAISLIGDEDGDHVLHFINFSSGLLFLTLPNGDSRVAAMLTSSSQVFKLLQRITSLIEDKFAVGKDHIIMAAFSLSSSLLKAVSRFKMQVDWCIQINVDEVVQLLTRRNIGMKASIYQLLTALFDSSFTSSIIVLKESSRQGLVSNEDVGLAIKSSTLRTIHVLLQNAVLQGSSFLAWNAVSCLLSMLNYLKDQKPTLACHLVNQPWNQFLVSCCFELHHDDPQPAWFLQLLAVLIEHKWCKSLLFANHLEKVHQRIWIQKCSEMDPLTLESTVYFMQQSMTVVAGAHRSAIQQNLKDWLASIKESVAQEARRRGTLPVEILEISGVIMIGDMRSLDAKDFSLLSRLGQLEKQLYEP